ncbi:MAG: hypothetical protein OEM42_09425 [Deltaproteobacteria bacterium]|nr:hypothetical protein [Deltaproteobacteria bacterium]
MLSLLRRLALRQDGNGRYAGLGLCDEMRLRFLARRLTFPRGGSRQQPGSGLINENGEPAWEDPSREPGHEFRNYVYEMLRCQEQA